MSIEAMTWALGVQVGDTTRKFVLAAYANHAHKDGRHAWPSKDTIAEYVECHPKTVTRHVKQLVADGWMRPGDQEQVAHIRADRRPVVYDLAMNEEVRAQWAAEPRGDRLSPREVSADHAEIEARPDTVSPRETGHGGTDGGTWVSSRGDTTVSPEQKEPRNLPRSPQSSIRTCQRHGTTQAPNCRGCGTTNRQIEAAAVADAAERRRLADAEQAAQDRAKKADRPDSDQIRRHLAEAGLR